MVKIEPNEHFPNQFDFVSVDKVDKIFIGDLKEVEKNINILQEKLQILKKEKK